MKIWFDVTKAATQRHRSGLLRVSDRLRFELGRISGLTVVEVVWLGRRHAWSRADGEGAIEVGPEDWVLTPELFSEDERPGLDAWLSRHGSRAAAIFHDAIPLRLPEITWPQSVARHPVYMRMLARFGRVFAVSAASARELQNHWASIGEQRQVAVTAIELGADGHGRARVVDAPSRAASHEVLMVGIVEPRKNQDAVLDAAEILAREGRPLAVTFVGRVNPHFGRDTAKRIRRLARRGLALKQLDSPDDAEVRALLERARFCVLPSRAEGCGLPVLEALWAGVPVLASALPSITESARGGGCLLVPENDPAAFTDGMRQLLGDDLLLARLQREACRRELPTWADTARAIVQTLTTSTSS